MKFPITSGHEVDSFKDLKSSDLAANNSPVEIARLFGTVGAHAPDEMRLGMNERAEQIVQSCVKILRQRRHGIVAIQSIVVGAKVKRSTTHECMEARVLI